MKLVAMECGTTHSHLTNFDQLVSPEWTRTTTWTDNSSNYRLESNLRKEANDDRIWHLTSISNEAWPLHCPFMIGAVPKHSFDVTILTPPKPWLRRKWGIAMAGQHKSRVELSFENESRQEELNLTKQFEKEPPKKFFNGLRSCSWANFNPKGTVVTIGWLTSIFFLILTSIPSIHGLIFTLKMSVKYLRFPILYSLSTYIHTLYADVRYQRVWTGPVAFFASPHSNSTVCSDKKVQSNWARPLTLDVRFRHDLCPRKVESWAAGKWAKTWPQLGSLCSCRG